MKRFLMIIILIMSLVGSASAQTYYYKTTAFAYKSANSYGRWTDWSDWEASDMVVTIDFTNDVVRIFSPTPQKYIITEYVRKFTDNRGGKQVEFSFIDQDYDKGTMRLRIEVNGNSQMYIEFSNVIWVYNVRRTG